MSWGEYRITRVITPAASFALVTVADAKAAIGIDPADTSQDAILGQQIDAVSLAINNWCNRIFVVQTYQDQLRNPHLCWAEPIVTRQYPVDDVTLAITVDGTAVDPTLFEVYPETGRLYPLTLSTADTGVSCAGVWCGSVILVDYTAGFDVIPADVQGAALEWVNARWNAIGRDPALRSETIPDVITQVWGGNDPSSASAMPDACHEWLFPYRIWYV
jgi:hypothetical protein